jgi:hypothetical protein
VAENNKAKIEVTAEYDKKSASSVESQVATDFKKMHAKLFAEQASVRKQYKQTPKESAERQLLGATLKEINLEIERVSRETIRAQRRFDDKTDPKKQPGGGGRRGGGFMGAVGSYGPQVLGAFSPLPGGQFAGGAVRGMQQAYWNEMYRAEAEDRKPKTGMAMLKGGAVGLGLAGLAAGVLGGVLGSRREETVGVPLGRLFGGKGAGDEITGLGAAYGFNAEQTTGIASAHGRAVGGRAGLAASLWSEQAYGLGGAAGGLLGAVGKTGGALDDPKAKDALRNVFAAGTAQGLKQGRFGELLEGVTGVVQQSRFGVDETGVERITQMLSKMGPGLQGAAGASALNQLDQAIKGQGGPLSRAIAMQNAGLGKDGQGYYTTLRKMEQGMFGSGEGGVRGDKNAAQKYFASFRRLMPGDSDEQKNARYNLISNQTGMKMELVEKLEKAAEGVSDKDWSDAKKAAVPKQDAAYEAMKTMGDGWRAFDIAVQNMENSLKQLLSVGGYLATMTAALNYLADFFGRVTKDPSKEAKAASEYGALLGIHPATPLGKVVKGGGALYDYLNEQFSTEEGKKFKTKVQIASTVGTLVNQPPAALANQMSMAAANYATSALIEWLVSVEGGGKKKVRVIVEDQPSKPDQKNGRDAKKAQPALAPTGKK